MKEQMDRLGMRSMWMDAFLLRKHKEEVLQVFDLLCDDISKQTYANVLLTRCGAQKRVPAWLYQPDAYYAIPQFCQIRKDDIFVDLGAYVGDTLESFVWKSSGVFGKIYAFEPETRNRAALVERIKRLKREWALGNEKIVIVPAGVGRETVSGHINGLENNAPSLGTYIDLQYGGGEEVMVYSLDDFFQKVPDPVNLIKADIESFEYEMLEGAKRTIQKHHPRLAICIYHSPSDLYTIPLLIKKYCPDYQFAVRHHSVSLAETVLYAYPDID